MAERRQFDVSVVVPIYDRTHLLEVALRSLAAQDFSGTFEILPVLDGSPSDTRQAVEEFARGADVPVRILSFQKSSGHASRARNAGILAARGLFVAFSDSDDYSHPSRLQVSFEHAVTSDLDMVCGKARYIGDGSRPDAPNFKSSGELERVTYPMLLMGNPVILSTAMVRRSTLLLHGGFRVKMRYREDHELWLRLAERGCRLEHVNSVFVDYLLHSGNNELNFKKHDEQFRLQMMRRHSMQYSVQDWGQRSK